MATKTASKSTSITKSSGAGKVSKSRYNEAIERAKSAGKRLREATRDDEDALIMVGSGVALAAIESKTTIPTVYGIDPAVLGGGLGYLFTRKAKGKTARMIRQAAIGVLTVGANRSFTRGSVKVGEDDDDDDDL